jgi:hypothetical protein
VAPNQRVMKPTDAQTSDLIRVACRRPDVRRGLVHEQLVNMEEAMRAHSERFGVDVGLQQIRMAGRVLSSPAVRYYSSLLQLELLLLCYANYTSSNAMLAVLLAVVQC